MTVKVTHPVYRVAPSPEEVERLRQAIAPLMAMSEADLIALVPDRTGFRFVGCPACDEGTQEGQLIWSVDDLRRVRCRYCGTVFPNERYPEDRVERVVNPLGVVVEYPYWADESGYPYFFSAKAWKETRFYLAARAEDLGALYQATGEKVYARRAALILDAFARYYPGFVVTWDWPHRPGRFLVEPPYPGGSGKWGRYPYQEMPVDVVFAYDSISSSGELERLSEEVGTDVRSRIENDFFRGLIRQDGFFGPAYGNASPRCYLGYVVIGRVLGDPALVHEGVRRSRRLYEQRFFVDGFWCQGSEAYHRMTILGMDRVFEVLRGYSDPPGYVDPEDGVRFDRIDLERELPMVERARRILEGCRYPDGRMHPMHDTWMRFEDLRVPERSVSTLLPGLGHAYLGRGTGQDQAQVHLHFSVGGQGHDHADNLALSLFAKGRELLPDLGYTHTRYRAWSRGTLSHNTVLIDEGRQYTGGDRGPSDGHLLAFETAFAPVQWMEARAERAYPGLARTYRRAVMLVEAGEGEVYVVDLFRVEGGSRHDWALHGDADGDGIATVSVPLRPFGKHMLPGVEVRYPAGESDAGDAAGRNIDYGFFQNVQRGMAEDGVTVTFSVSGSRAGVGTHLPGLEGAEVFLGDAPSLRRAQENDALLDRFRMPIFLVRREGAVPLSSRFVAVHEPYAGMPFIEAVRIEACNEDRDALALSIKHHGVTDHIVHRTTLGETAVGALRLRGEVAFVRERDGRPEMMGLWGGTEVRWKGWTLKGDGVHEGTVRAALRADAGDGENALVVTGDLPEGETLKGRTVVMRFGDGSTRGCRIAGVKSSGGESHLLLEDDPGISVNGGAMRHLFFPLCEIPGEVTYRIRASVFKKFKV